MAGEKLVRRALEAVRKPAAAPREGIRAYHSSPHDFDRFDLSKIGTGEGAQAYGHGLYFAESPKVSGQGGDYWRQFWNKMPSGPERSAATALFANKFDRDKAIDHLLRDIEYNSARGVPGKYGNGPDIEEGHRLLAQEGQQALDILRSGQIAGPRTYEVNIRANPEQFLDWDKPLREQPEVVQNFFQARVNPSKGRAYNDDEFRSAFGNPLSGTPYEGAASSRGFLEPILSGGQESADFVNLVAKSNPEAASSLQAAIDKYARFNSPTGADVYQAIAHSNRSTIGFVPSFDRGVSASQELLEAGIPGIKYLDAGSRDAGEGTRNYVVFDDRMVDIMKKYGLPMMTAGAGAASMADQPVAQEEPRDGFADGGVILKALRAVRGLPPAENSRLTQIATTGPSYDKALRHLERAGIEGRAIDYGAGRGHGLRSIGADTFEPYPQGWTPTFTKPEDIPDDVYRRLVNLNVLNVLDPEARQSAVLNMGRIVEPGGGGVISTRGRDVMAARGEPGPEPMSLIIGEGDSARYQKGFTPRELREYVGDTLGPRFDVEPSDVGAASIMFRRNREDGGPVEEREGYQKGGVIARAIEAARKAVAPKDLLMGIHNTAEGRKLDMIERLGGLPAPSIAITKPSQGYTSFGDISLVAPVEMVTPGRKTPVFGSDVYSPRFPDVEDDQIFRGFTPAGRRRYAPLTMENVLREMKGNIRGGESFNYGPASIRAQVTPQFGSLPEMQAARDKIIPASEFGAQKDMSAEMMERLRERFEPYFKPTDSYRRSWSAFPEVLTDYARTGRPSEFAYDYKDLPAEALTDARSFLSHLRDMPTEYFEAKPQRGVPLSEFAGAVVPADVPGSVVDRIRNMGINRIEEYGDDASRAAALMKFVGEQGFADGGGVKGGRLLEDEYPTQYLPNVGRQVMADGGSPAAEKYEAMPGFFSRMLGLSGGSQPEADIQQYENRMRAIAQQPEDIRSMTHAPSKPMRPIEIEGGFIGKRQLGEAPYDVAGPLSGMAQAAYSLKTVPFYFTPAAPLAAASDFGEAVIDTKSALDKGDYLGAGVTGALGVAAPAVAYRRQAGDAVRSGLEAARRFVARNPGTATAVGAGAATLAPEDAEASGSGLIRRGLDAVRGVRAYHGSPHSFDRFDLSKIGTGEGAQAYGHGLYFAEAEPVARGYRDKLTSGTYKTSAGEIFDPFTLEHLNIKVPAYKSIDNAIERGFELLQTQPERRDLITRDLNRLMAARDAGAVPNPGSMYEVNIRANPEQFLDWDKPAAEQPMLNRLPMITDLRRDIGPQEFNRMSFGGAYETLGNAGELEEAARKAGIPGIKYLDQGSRGAGEGSRNYVVFDDKLIDILRKYGIPLMAAGTGASALQDVSSPREETVP